MKKSFIRAAFSSIFSNSSERKDGPFCLTISAFVGTFVLEGSGLWRGSDWSWPHISEPLLFTYSIFCSSQTLQRNLSKFCFS